MSTIEISFDRVFWNDEWIGDGRIAISREVLDLKRLHKDVLVVMSTDEGGSDTPEEDMTRLKALIAKITAQIANYSICEVLPLTYWENKRQYLVLSLSGVLYFLDRGFIYKRNLTFMARDNSLGLTDPDGWLDLNAVIVSSDGGETIDAVLKPAQVAQVSVDALAVALKDKKSAVVG